MVIRWFTENRVVAAVKPANLDKRFPATAITVGAVHRTQCGQVLLAFKPQHAVDGHPPVTSYGSNMDPEQFGRRCPQSRVLGPATLAHHRFFITDRGYASIETRIGSLVQGILAELTEADEASLDYFEGVRHFIYRKESIVVGWDGWELPALVYVDNETAHGRPKPGYLERVLMGARHHGLPPEAVEEIEAWGATR